MYYVLKGRRVIPATCLEWAEFFQSSNRHVACDERGDQRVSTVFVGLGLGQDPPLVFETRIFGGPHDGRYCRTATWWDAERAHAEALGMLRAGMH